MSEHVHKATDRVRRFLDARDGYFPIDVLAVVTRTGDRLLASDLRTLLTEVDEAWADGYNHAKVEMLSATIGERAECATCSGRGVWMDEPCLDCAPFYCYPCARGDHDEHKLAWVPDIPCECPECVTPPEASAD